MLTPYFPTLRSRLAALGRRTAQTVRQTTLAQLQQRLRDWLPAPLLASEDEGPNNVLRSYSPGGEESPEQLPAANGE